MPQLAPYPDPDRLLGCLLGGAIGDALGAPIEFKSLAAIRAIHGDQGLTGFSPDQGRAGTITDDTQMTLFTAEALIQASVRERAKGIGGATTGLLQESYLSWLRTQGEEIPAQSLSGGGRLFALRELHARRYPGGTCVSALHQAAARQRPGLPLGTVEEPINDSKGCGGVMRAAPCGFPYRSVGVAFQTGCEAAALTHGHPSGYLTAGVLAATVWGLLRGATLPAALEAARAELERHQAHQETSAALEAAVALAGQGPPTPERLETLGGGWVGEEALAIGVCAALAADGAAGAEDPAATGRRGLLLAVNHSGDSDSTGSICGNLLGARHGTAALPGHWQAGVELRQIITLTAADCALEFGPNPPESPDGYGGPPPGWPGDLLTA